MALKSFRKPQQNDAPTQALSQAVADFTRQLTINPLLDGRILASVDIGTAATDIVHGLGRPFVGWVITRRTDDAAVHEDTQTNTSQYLTLIADSATTVDLYVF